jgi:hypothetical protein
VEESCCKYDIANNQRKRKTGSSILKSRGVYRYKEKLIIIRIYNDTEVELGAFQGFQYNGQ